MSETPTCYMAVKFAATDGGWVDTGQDVMAPGLPTGDGKTLPTSPAVYGDVYNAKFRAEREFEAINSSGGPQTAFQPSFEGMEIERLGGDAVSPLLFDYCLTGKQIEWVYLVLPVQGHATNQPVVYVEQYHVRLGGVHVARFDAGARRFMGRTIDDEFRSPEVSFTLAIDEIELVYTTIALESLGVERGWDLQTNKLWNTPSS